MLELVDGDSFEIHSNNCDTAVELGNNQKG